MSLLHLFISFEGHKNSPQKSVEIHAYKTTNINKFVNLFLIFNYQGFFILPLVKKCVNPKSVASSDPCRSDLWSSAQQSGHTTAGAAEGRRSVVQGEHQLSSEEEEQQRGFSRPQT